MRAKLIDHELFSRAFQPDFIGIMADITTSISMEQLQALCGKCLLTFATKRPLDRFDILDMAISPIFSYFVIESKELIRINRSAATQIESEATRVQLRNRPMQFFSPRMQDDDELQIHTDEDDFESVAVGMLHCIQYYAECDEVFCHIEAELTEEFYDIIFVMALLPFLGTSFIDNLLLPPRALSLLANTTISGKLDQLNKKSISSLAISVIRALFDYGMNSNTLRNI